MNGGKLTSTLRCAIIVYCWLGHNRGPEIQAAVLTNAESGSNTIATVGSEDEVGGKSSQSSSYCFEPITGLKVNYSNNELIVRYAPRTYNQDTAVESREKEGKQKTGIMQKMGAFMMMIPIGMQLLKIPLELANVKMTLIRSILVAKVALFMLLLRVIFMHKSHQKVVIVKAPPKEVHEHFYHPFEHEEDVKHGWLDNPPPWMN